MKLYFRLLKFARPIEKYAIPYVIFTLLSIIFGLLNYTLLIPVFNLLFNEKIDVPKLSETVPAFTLSFEYFQNLFYHFFYKTITEHDKLWALGYVCLVIGISILLSNIFKYFSQLILEELRINTLLNLRKTVYNRVLDLHLGFFSNEKKGEIMSKISGDVQVVQGSVTNSLIVFFREPLTIVVYFIALFKLSFSLTIFTLFFIPVSGVIIALIVKKLKQITKEAQTSMGVMLSILDESLTGLRVIKAFNATPYFQQKFHQENIKYSNSTRQMVKKNELASPVSEIMGVFVVIGILMYGGAMVLKGDNSLKPEWFVAYVAIFSQVLRPAKAMTGSFSAIQHGISAGERVLELIDVKPQIFNKDNAVSLQKFEKEITFDNVSFSYGHTEVLREISFTIPKGKTVALVGPSGGGKSTISDLIPRFYDPQKGSISIDGTDIKDCTLESLRDLMGIVNQESLLFNDTIFNNIAFAKSDASYEEVMHAAKVANAHDFIMKSENGYNTVIGDRGVKLSGGQKQRLSIARAILKNPPILILDEATSALDTESEKLVQDALNTLMKNRTTLVIAHRLSTIKSADKILVIDKGKIVESGRHEDLMNIEDGVYKKLNQTQESLHLS
ncbi:MAG: ABC transporter ATP-binding protein [Cytophagaceae bacterium]